MEDCLGGKDSTLTPSLCLCQQVLGGNWPPRSHASCRCGGVFAESRRKQLLPCARNSPCHAVLIILGARSILVVVKAYIQWLDIQFVILCHVPGHWRSSLGSSGLGGPSVLCLLLLCWPFPPVMVSSVLFRIDTGFPPMVPLLGGSMPSVLPDLPPFPYP